jgi:hypothetical protein
VINGTANATTQWVLTSKITTVGTDALTYAQFTANPANNVLAVSPGVGLCHFAGGTQTCTSSAVTPGDATGNTSGSGNFCLATSCTMVTPALGTPASGVLTNITGLPLTTGVTGVLPVTNGGTGTANAVNFFQNQQANWTQASSAADTTNQIRLLAFFVPNTITVSNIGYDAQTADNSANSYDLGAYGPGCFNGTASIALAYHTGTTAGTTLAPSTGFKTIAITGAPKTLQPGWYCYAWTSNAATPAFIAGGSTSTLFVLPFTTTTIAGGGATLPGTITAPALSFGLTSSIAVALW